MSETLFYKNTVKNVLQVFDCKEKNSMIVCNCGCDDEKNVESRCRNCGDTYYLVN